MVMHFKKLIILMMVGAFIASCDLTSDESDTTTGDTQQSSSEIISSVDGETGPMNSSENEEKSSNDYSSAVDASTDDDTDESSSVNVEVSSSSSVLIVEVESSEDGVVNSSGDVTIDIEKSICLDFTYSTCPSTCQSQCVSSSCGPNPAPDMMCTADCDGAESCVEPSSSAILELEEKRLLWNNAVGNTNKRLTYTVFKGCHCLPETTGPFTVTAVGNAVLGAEHTGSQVGYYLDTEMDGKPESLKLGMNDLFDAIKEELIRIETSGDAGEENEYKGITYDPDFGYPLSVNIGPIEVDGGLSFTVDSLVVADDKDPADVLEEKEAAYKEWVYENGGNATYMLSRSCFCGPDYMGPFTVTLRDNEVTNVLYSGDEPIDIAIDPVDFEDYSIQNLFNSISASIDRQPYVLSIEYFSDYPFPKMYGTGTSPMIADGGGAIRISDVVIE